jgi:hypothetical protein
MIKSSNVMQGNLVYDLKNNIVELTNVDIRQIDKFEKIKRKLPFFPIPITDEVLKKCNPKISKISKDKKTYSWIFLIEELSKWTISIDFIDKSIFCIFVGQARIGEGFEEVQLTSIPNEIKYFHDFQNFFKLFTGTDLKVNISN